MTLNKDLLSTGVGKPSAGGRRRFSAYALQLLGAVVGASATILTVLVLPTPLCTRTDGKALCLMIAGRRVPQHGVVLRPVSPARTPDRS